MKIIIRNNYFWCSANYALKTIISFVKILQMGDDEKITPMVSIYDTINKAKKDMIGDLRRQETTYKKI